MEQLLLKLADQGVVAIILALSVSGNVYQYKENQKLQEKRLLEAVQYKNMLSEPIIAIKKAGETMQSTVNAILDLVTKQNGK